MWNSVAGGASKRDDAIISSNINMCLQVHSSRSRLQLAGGAQLTALYLDCFLIIAYQRLRFMLFWGLGTIVLRLSVFIDST